MDLQKVFSFIAFTQKFRAITRDVYFPEHKRNENDMEHSYQLAMLAWYLNSSFKLGFDTELLLKYALAHELVETYAGDTPALTSSQDLIASKVAREKKALEKIQSEHSEFSDVFGYMQGYSDKVDKESRFVAGLDKIMPMINELQNQTDYYKKNNITIEKWQTWLADKLDKMEYSELDDGGFMEAMKKCLVDEKERMFAN